MRDLRLGDGAVKESAVIADHAEEIDYGQLVVRVRELIESCVPEGSTVAVVSRGDGDLLRIVGRTGWHFPRTETGSYAGHHPADDGDAIARLETTRSDGAQYLVIPATAYWWLDHYAGFKRHLDEAYRRIADESATAVVISLEGTAPVGRPAREQATDHTIAQLQTVTAALLPAGANVAVISGGDARFLALGAPVGGHFPQGLRPEVAGPEPENDEAAIACLEIARRSGAEFLLVPQASYWWLERFSEFRAHLGQRHQLVTLQQNLCVIYDLRLPQATASTVAGFIRQNRKSKGGRRKRA